MKIINLQKNSNLENSKLKGLDFVGVANAGACKESYIDLFCIPSTFGGAVSFGSNDHFTFGVCFGSVDLEMPNDLGFGITYNSFEKAFAKSNKLSVDDLRKDDELVDSMFESVLYADVLSEFRELVLSQLVGA